MFLVSLHVKWHVIYHDFFLFNGTWPGVIRPCRLRSRESWRYGIGKSAAVRGLERGTSFGEVRAPYLQATPAGLIIIIIIMNFAALYLETNHYQWCDRLMLSFRLCGVLTESKFQFRDSSSTWGQKFFIHKGFFWNLRFFFFCSVAIIRTRFWFAERLLIDYTVRLFADVCDFFLNWPLLSDDV